MVGNLGAGVAVEAAEASGHGCSRVPRLQLKVV